jgi:8-oxo-dGTP diphosphatase/putative hydrolase of the HAD superfamily
MARGQRIVFFDVGNVLIDEDPFLSESFRLIHRAIPTTSPKAQMERYLILVERALRTHLHLAVERVGYRSLGKNWPKVRRAIGVELDRRWWNLARPIPGARGALERLKTQWRLGILANQPPQALEFLEKEGLLELFDVVILDSQHSVSKPDPAIYRIALEEAKVDPQDALMVGDRLDNDVVPARRLGMRAVLLWIPTGEKGWEPRDEWGGLLRPILERLPAPRLEHLLPRERPMAVAKNWEEVGEAVANAWMAEI